MLIYMFFFSKNKHTEWDQAFPRLFWIPLSKMKLGRKFFVIKGNENQQQKREVPLRDSVN